MTMKASMITGRLGAAMAAALATGGPANDDGEAVVIDVGSNRGKPPRTEAEQRLGMERVGKAIQQKRMQELYAIRQQQEIEKAAKLARASVALAAAEAARVKRRKRNQKIAAAGGYGVVAKGLVTAIASPTVVTTIDSPTLVSSMETSTPVAVGQVMESTLIMSTPLPRAEVVADPMDTLRSSEHFVSTPAVAVSSMGVATSPSDAELNEARTVMWILAKLPKTARPANFKTMTDKTHEARKKMKLPRNFSPIGNGIYERIMQG